MGANRQYSNSWEHTVDDFSLEVPKLQSAHWWCSFDRLGKKRNSSPTKRAEELECREQISVFYHGCVHSSKWYKHVVIGKAYDWDHVFPGSKKNCSPVSMTILTTADCREASATSWNLVPLWYWIERCFLSDHYFWWSYRRTLQVQTEDSWNEARKAGHRSHKDTLWSDQSGSVLLWGFY